MRWAHYMGLGLEIALGHRPPVHGAASPTGLYLEAHRMVLLTNDYGSENLCHLKRVNDVEQG